MGLMKQPERKLDTLNFQLVRNPGLGGKSRGSVNQQQVINQSGPANAGVVFLRLMLVLINMCYVQHVTTFFSPSHGNLCLHVRVLIVNCFR